MTVRAERVTCAPRWSVDGMKLSTHPGEEREYPCNDGTTPNGVGRTAQVMTGEEPDSLSRRGVLQSGAALAGLSTLDAVAARQPEPAKQEPPDSVAETEPDDAATIVDGNARFQMLSTGLIRLEYAPTGSFEDQPTMTAVNRSFPTPEFETRLRDGLRHIETDRVRLAYEVGTGPFTDRNTAVQVRVGERWVDASLEWREPDQRYEQPTIPRTLPRPKPDPETDIESIADRAAGEGTLDAPSVTEDRRDADDLGGWYRALDNQVSARDLNPGLLSREGYRLLDDSFGALRTADAATPRDRPSEYRDGYLFAYGREYKQALRDFAALTGPAPMLPEETFGVWYSRWWPYSAEDFRDIVARFREEDVPLSTLVIDTDYSSPNTWNGWNWNESRFPDPEGFIEWAHDEGLLVSLNVHPSIDENDPQFESANETANGLIPDNGRGYFYTQSPSKTYVWDWARPAHRESYFELHDRFEEQGVDFWWPDWCCDESRSSMPGIPPDALLNDGYARRQRERGRRGFALSRIGSSFHKEGASVPGPWAAHRHAIHFTGDTSPTWEMLDFQIGFTVAENAIGLPYVSHDIGSFHGVHLPDDMYVRWVQFGTFQPILRLHSNHGDRLPWDYSPPAETIAKRFLRLRNRLVPYLYSLARESHDEGLPICRAMWLSYPERNRAYTFDRQYLLGENLLVAPIATPGTSTSKEVWFPPAEGGWVNIFTGDRYAGGQVVSVTAPLERIPVFAKAGTVLPLAPLTDCVGDEPEARILRVYTGADGATELYDDAGSGLGYRDDEFGRTPIQYQERPPGHQVTVEGMDGTYPGRPERRSYRVQFIDIDRPEHVIVPGEGRMRDWTYDAAARQLTVDIGPRPIEARTVIRIIEN